MCSAPSTARSSRPERCSHSSACTGAGSSPGFRSSEASARCWPCGSTPTASHTNRNETSAGLRPDSPNVPGAPVSADLEIPAEIAPVRVAREATADQGSHHPLRRRGRRRLCEHRGRARRGGRFDRPQRRGKDIAHGCRVGLRAATGHVALEDQPIDDVAKPPQSRCGTGPLLPGTRAVRRDDDPGEPAGATRQDRRLGSVDRARPACRTSLPPVTIAAIKEFGLEPVLHMNFRRRSPTVSGA